MIEMRWYVDGEKRVLQTRQLVDVTIRAGMWSPEETMRTAKFQWTEWTDVPIVHAPMVAEITAESVSYLREISDCSMMQCKKALTACNGDMVKAIEWLRTHRGFYV